MKIQKVLFTVAAVAGGAMLASCGGSGHDENSLSGDIDTARVLGQARTQPETTEPSAVDDDALRFTDVSESADPIDINAS